MIHLQDRDGVTVLQIEHGKANVLDTDLLDSFNDLLDSLETSETRALVLTGTGKNFSAGVDLFQVMEGGEDYLEWFLPSLTGAIRRLFGWSKPVIAAVNGHAIAGGCLLAAACDYRIMTTDKAKIGVTELLVGVPFPVAAMEVLRFHFDDRRAQDLIYSAVLSSPEQALEIGWVERLADPDHVVDEAVALARKWARIPESAFAVTKRQLRHEVLDRMDRYALQLDEEIRGIWQEPQTLDGIRAFMAATVGKKG